MKRWGLSSAILVAITGLAAPMRSAHAAQPPDGVASDGNGNTASGTDAQLYLSAAGANSAFGYGALELNSTGPSNSAFGYQALYQGSGSSNSGFGYQALYNNSANYNVAFGFVSLSNSSGDWNSAVGAFSLWENTTGTQNTAVGGDALSSNGSGSNNTAIGFDALTYNTTGKGNEAQGAYALFSNTTGIRNLAIGSNALYNNTTGGYNIALGFDAGQLLTTGDDNIYIANQGMATESQTLRLGTQGTSGVPGSGILSAYVAGVATTTVIGSAVFITPAGQLGVLASSERFKTDVESMGAASEKLEQLRPVTFKLKSDPSRTLQYGLIAEEVAKVYPELVIHGADGRINGVRYEELAPMLLNVVQQQQAQLATQTLQINDLRREQAQLRKQFAELARRSRAAGAAE